MPSKCVEEFNRTMDAVFTSPVFKSFLAGSFSGTCSTIVFQPLDLIKTRIQAPMTVGSATEPMRLIKTFTAVVRNEKITGLWKGITPSVTRTVPGVGIYFCSLHWLKASLDKEDPSPLEAILLGAGARSFSGVAMLPFTVIKTRFESKQYNYSGMIQAVRVIYSNEGFHGLYSGLLATLLRDAPFSGLYLMFYTQSKKIVPSRAMESGYVPAVHFTCGLFAGMLASVATQPADVIKTKMQIFPNRFRNVFDVIVYVNKVYGPRGFLKGLVPRTLRRTLMAAMAWTVYESVMKNIGIK